MSSRTTCWLKDVANLKGKVGKGDLYYMKELFIALIIVSGLTATSVMAVEIKVEGGGAAISTVFQPMKETFEKVTGDTLTIIASTPVNGLLALDKGRVDIATCAYPFDELLSMAEKENAAIDHLSFWSIIISENRTVVFTNKANPVKKLSGEQLRGIFSGKTTNWQQVGGENTPIQVVWSSKTLGQNAGFINAVMHGTEISKNTLVATDYTHIRELISKIPGAIGIDPIGFKSAEIRTPEIPILTSPIIAVTKGAPSAKALKVIDFYRQNVHFME